MGISLAKQPTPTPSFDLLKKPPRSRRRSLNFDSAPGGLVPLGDSGLWVTPDEPADPQDCERYEGSAFCTPFFFTLTPVSLVPAIVIDNCNIGIRLDGSLGFIRVPPIAIVYRDPSDACKPPLPPTSPPGEGGLVSFPYNICDETTQSIIVIAYSRVVVEEWYNEKTQLVSVGGAQLVMEEGFYSAHYTTTYTVESIEFPYKGTIGDYIDANGIPRKKYSAKINFGGVVTFNQTRNYTDLYGVVGSPTSGSVPVNAYFLMGDTVRSSRYGGTKVLILQMSVVSAKERLKDLANEFSTTPHYNNAGEVDGYGTIQTTYDIVIKCGKETRDKNVPSPPEYNPPPRRCCMSCCPSQGEQDNSLLALLIQKVDKLSNVVGVDEYPVSLPTSLISKDEGFLGNLIPNNNVDIPNLTVFFAWYIERFDEIMGQWEIPIEVKDTDPTKPGDQPVGFRLPNMAEAIAEMFGLMLQTSINTQIGINMQTRTMLEVGQNKQQGFKSYMLVLAIADHLGFDYKEVKHKIPMLFDITQTQLDKLLQESEIEVSAVDYTDKEDLKIVLLELRQAAAIIKAVHWRKFDLKSDVAKGVKDLIMGLVATSDEVNDSKKDEEDGKDKFDDFLEDAERGFTTSSGITDTDHPYGRNYNERPRIKEIGQESPGV